MEIGNAVVCRQRVEGRMRGSWVRVLVVLAAAPLGSVVAVPSSAHAGVEADARPRSLQRGRRLRLRRSGCRPFL